MLSMNNPLVSEPMAAFPHNHGQRRGRNESCCNEIINHWKDYAKLENKKVTPSSQVLYTTG